MATYQRFRDLYQDLFKCDSYEETEADISFLWSRIEKKPDLIAKLWCIMDFKNKTMNSG